MNLPNDRMIKELATDFVQFVDLLVKDATKIAEMQHNVGAFTSVNLVLACCYMTMTGVDPLNKFAPVTPDKVLEWAKSIQPESHRRIKWHKGEVSEDMVQIIQILAVDLDKAVNKDGASFGFVIGLVVALGRAYYVVNGVDLLVNANDVETHKKLINWAWSFRVVERETKVII